MDGGETEGTDKGGGRLAGRFSRGERSSYRHSLGDHKRMGIVKTKQRVANYCFRPSDTVLNNNGNASVPELVRE